MNTKSIAYAAQLADEFQVIYDGASATSVKHVHALGCASVAKRNRNVPASPREVRATSGLAACCSAHADRFNELAEGAGL